MEKVRKYLKEFGFLDEDINIILTIYPINNLSEDTLLNHCVKNNNFFLEIGYSKLEIIKMTKSSPALCGYSIENIKQKIEDLVSLGYSKTEVIKMTKSLPTLYGLSIENIKQKILYLKEIKLDFIALSNTRQLMQSIDLTFARYEFLKESDIIVNNENYRLLFKSNMAFSKQFNITKEELLKKYPYQNKDERRK